ncbi:MAG: NAD-dependent epimerase/dehydratase family protein [Desulfobacter sp.]|nr:MAG: NAD-dependent epimerase/dehydratase family protein [Desulfobacter sp.]
MGKRVQNILVTGSSGYLGSKLMEALEKKKGVGTVVGMDIAPPSPQTKPTSFLKMDIRDHSLDKILAKNQIDTVIHLAFVVKPIHNLKIMHDIDYNGTLNVLEKSYDAGVRHLIAVSSTLAYGAHPNKQEPLKEKAPLKGNPSFPYEYNKALVDKMIQAFAKTHPNMIITTLRPCTVFGPTAENYVSRMLLRPLTVNIRNSNPKVQFVHETDFVRACLMAVEKRLPGAFNIVGQGVLTVKEIAAMAKTRLISIPAAILYPVVDLLWHLRIPGVEVNRGYLDYARHPFIASPEKAKAKLGFVPRYSSRKILEDMIRSRNHDDRQA